MATNRLPIRITRKRLLKDLRKIVTDCVAPEQKATLIVNKTYEQNSIRIVRNNVETIILLDE